MNIPIDEQETIVNISRSGAKASVYTSDSRYQTKLNHLCQNFPETWKTRTVFKTKEGEVTGIEYECPAYMISFRGKDGRKNVENVE